jgi:hypothetical protein
MLSHYCRLFGSEITKIVKINFHAYSCQSPRRIKSIRDHDIIHMILQKLKCIFFLLISAVAILIIFICYQVTERIFKLAKKDI